MGIATPLERIARVLEWMFFLWTVPCVTCGGGRKVTSLPTGTLVDCERCRGTGRMARSEAGARG